jgi:hypothetical protein
MSLADYSARHSVDPMGSRRNERKTFVIPSGNRRERPQAWFLPKLHEFGLQGNPGHPL